MSNNVGENGPDGRRPGISRLYAIVYISTAARLLSLDELEHIRSRAQMRNREEDVTGVLLYSAGAFMQYLEGPACGLARIYSCIKADPLHYGIIDLCRESIQQRAFGAWSMALRTVDDGGHALPSEHDALISGAPATPATLHSAARQLLIEFWGKGRTSVASTLLDLSTQRASRVGRDLLV